MKIEKALLWMAGVIAVVIAVMASQTEQFDDLSVVLGAGAIALAIVLSIYASMHVEWSELFGKDEKPDPDPVDDSESDPDDWDGNKAA